MDTATLIDRLRAKAEHFAGWDGNAENRALLIEAADTLQAVVDTLPDDIDCWRVVQGTSPRTNVAIARALHSRIAPISEALSPPSTKE